VTVIICPQESDEHAPFAHRLVIGSNGTFKPLVICAYCDHWVRRVVTGCACPVDCHGQMSAQTRLDDPKIMDLLGLVE
jgi:hypothetical protein